MHPFKYDNNYILIKYLFDKNKNLRTSKPINLKSYKHFQLYFIVDHYNTLLSW